MTLSLTPLFCYEAEQTALDAVGNGPELNAYPDYEAGKVGSYAFGNSIDEVRCIGSNAATITNAILSSSNWSVAAWQKLGSHSTDGKTVYGQLSSTTAGKHYSFKIKRHLVTATYYFKMQVAGATNVDFVSSIPISTDWIHWVVVNEAGTIAVYLNGVLVGSGTLPATSSVSNHVIGVVHSPADFSASDQFAGWTAALTADDATYLYNSGAGRAYADWEVAESPATGRSFVNKQCFLTA